MNNDDIKKLIEDGFSIKAIYQKTGRTPTEIKSLGWTPKKEEFSEEQIPRIKELYSLGVSAKTLGKKFNIDKRRVQKWAKEKGDLRSKEEAARFFKFDEHIFDVIDTPTKAYWLGFFYADAYNNYKTWTVNITLKQEDKEHLNKLQKFFGFEENRVNNIIRKNDNYAITNLKLHSKYLCQKLIELGCPQAKSFIIKFPEFIDKNLYEHFIRGYFDGDGSLCFRKNQKEWKFSIVSTQELCKSIIDFFKKEINIDIKIHCISSSNNNTYELEKSGNQQIKIIMDWLYKNSSLENRLDRKYDKYKELYKYINDLTYSKNKYKLSDNDKENILKEINSGNSIGNISDKFKIHPRTITKLISNSDNENINIKFNKIAIVNDHQITASYVKKLNYDQRLELVEPLFKHFRGQGWLYPDNISQINNEWIKLCEYQPDLTKNELFNNSSLATGICKYFCHSFYNATEMNSPNMQEIFNDNDKLKYLIKNRLGFNWQEKWNTKNDETFNISFKMLIQGMRSSRLVPAISIFKPSIAKYICLKYSNENDIYLDYSAGFGGRMLGAASCNRKYIGIDPLTTGELTKMAEYLKLPNVSLINDGSENVKLSENSIDLIWSSPPYFNQEVYALNDMRQSYNQGEYYFYNIYWKNTLENMKYMLKPGKIFGLNILKKYDQMIKMTKDYFGEPIEEIKLKTVRNHLLKAHNLDAIKYEPIYIFKNIK